MLAMVVLVVGLFVVALVVVPELRYRSAKRSAIQRLASAATHEERADAVGGLGVVLRLPEENWVAIAYADSHQGWGFYSCAIALCSDGAWFESSEHYCGEFAAYAGTRRWLSEGAATQESLEEQRLFMVESAPDLPGAKAKLMEMGFTPFNP